MLTQEECHLLRCYAMWNVPSSPILVTLMMEALCSSETSVLTRATWRNIPEDGIPHTHRRENLKSYPVHSKYSCIMKMKATFFLNVSNKYT
jgi:hypothetical protein